MDDANDFFVDFGQSHQGEIKSRSDTLAIGRIRRANAQKHVTVAQTNSSQNSSNGRKYCMTNKSVP